MRRIMEYAGRIAYTSGYTFIFDDMKFKLSKRVTSFYIDKFHSFVFLNSKDETLILNLSTGKIEGTLPPATKIRTSPTKIYLMQGKEVVNVYDKFLLNRIYQYSMSKNKLFKDFDISIRYIASPDEALFIYDGDKVLYWKDYLTYPLEADTAPYPAQASEMFSAGESVNILDKKHAKIDCYSSLSHQKDTSYSISYFEHEIVDAKFVEGYLKNRLLGLVIERRYLVLYFNADPIGSVNFHIKPYYSSDFPIALANFEHLKILDIQYNFYNGFVVALLHETDEDEYFFFIAHKNEFFNYKKIIAANKLDGRYAIDLKEIVVWRGGKIKRIPLKEGD